MNPYCPSIIAQKKERKAKYLERIVQLHDLEKKNFSQIGNSIGLSANRAAQLYKQAVRFIESRNDESFGLSVRALNVLNNANLRSKAEVIAKIDSEGPQFLKRYRNCGVQTASEILMWAKGEKLILPAVKTIVSACPHCGGLISSKIKSKKN